MMQSIYKLFFLSHGRLRRRTYWWTVLLATLVFSMSYVFLDNSISHASTLVLYPPFLWIAMTLMIKRLHDKAKSGWWLLVVVIPVLGPALLAFWMWLGRGTVGENQYGDDPRLINADYLTVRISQ